MSKRILDASLLLTFALCIGGCDGSGGTVKQAKNAADNSAGIVDDQARVSLLERDLAFGNAVAEFGLAEAYSLFLADDAVQLPDGDWPLRGRKIIYEQIKEATGDSDFLLSWKPEVAEVSVSGDLGYTWGTYWLELLDEDDNPLLIEGNYVNVWRKSSDDVWEVIVDISNQIATDYIPTAVIDLDDSAMGPELD